MLRSVTAGTIGLKLGVHLMYGYSGTCVNSSFLSREYLIKGVYRVC